MKKLGLIAFLGLFFACQPAQEIIPSPIPEEELITLLADAMLIEPAIKELPYQSRDSLATIYYTRMLANTDYSLETYKESLRWMQKEPERLQDIYAKVMKELEEREIKKEEKPGN